MSSPQYEKLKDVCERLDAVYTHLQNRRMKPAATTTDGYLNDKMSQVLTPLRNHLITYRDFHQQYTDDEGNVDRAQRGPLFDLLADIERQMNGLTGLVENTMCRTGGAPGSMDRLSDLFKRVALQERHTLTLIRNDMRFIFWGDINALKFMPRVPTGLRLVASNKG